MSAERPLPRFPEPDTQAFWEGAREGGLRFQRCAACGTAVYYPRRHCTGCGGADLRWEASAGRGSVYTFTVIRQNGQPWFSERVPYVLALVDLDEGVRVLTNVVGVAPEGVAVGMRVHVDWDQHGEQALPCFRPD